MIGWSELSQWKKSLFYYCYVYKEAPDTTPWNTFRGRVRECYPRYNRSWGAEVVIRIEVVIHIQLNLKTIYADCFSLHIMCSK